MSSLLYSVGPVSVFPYAKWGPLARHLAKQYRAAKPFPHIELTPFLEPDVAQEMAMTFPRSRSAEWIHYKHANEDKLGLNRRDLFPAPIGDVVDELNSPAFVSWLGELTGIPNLFPDPALDGGGLHQSERGGFLNIHTDFSVHHHFPHWERRVNLILYLNPGWDEKWGGALEFWDAGMKRCAVQCFPKLNHAVIFNTDQKSLHGFPEPIRCPDHVTRKSLALYFYTNAARERGAARSTNYHARPEDGLVKSLKIRLDTYAVNLYSKAKRRFQFSDRVASKVLSLLSAIRQSSR